MTPLAKTILTSLTLITTLTVQGCDNREAEIAREAADRQADQNREMIRLNREVAAGTSRLVIEDAKARQQALRVQSQLQSERAGLSEGWGQLEAERKQLADARRTDSALAALVSGGAATLSALVALSLAWIALHRGDPADDLAASVCTLIMDDGVSPSDPTLISACRGRFPSAGDVAVNPPLAPESP